MKFKIYLFTCFFCITLFVNAQPYTSFANSEYNDIPGYVNPDDYIGKTCFDFMGKVDFTSAYRFKSDIKNGANDVMYGFSIPLVADLNGDGYPEIIGISSDGAISAIEGKYNGIQILNGQTGQLISKIKFPWLTGGYYYHLGHHGSPSIMALVDSDRDGTVEIIFAIPYRGGAPTSYHNTLVSCDIIHNKTTETYSLRERWKAHNFHSPASVDFEKPIPQVVDLNGDGIPEVVVYNKIYNAVDGSLLFTLETLKDNPESSDAYYGGGVKGGYPLDRFISFNYVYDMDLDGVYDIVAGGKIYKMLTDNTGKLTGYQTISMSGVPDGKTGVADINGDGIPDVITATRTSNTEVDITVWNPGFWKINEQTGQKEKQSTPKPEVLAQVTLPLSYQSTASTGSNSYIYIGDIDGREQVVGDKVYRLPEIAILGGRYTYNANIHPNVANKGIPTSGLSSSVGSGNDGVLIAVTWDATATSVTQRLKTSFVLGHDDSSTNTGFTMFDFDNDGIMEICYRDEKNLRIIKPTKPYITASDTSSDVIKFTQPVKSFTGFEYPVIADIDNDASAEIIVMGHNKLSLTDATGYVYAVGNGTGDKFAPARAVWNQFMYDPFKINDDLTTPIGPAPNRLDKKYAMTKIIRDENMQIEKVIENYNPFNGTLTQSSKIQIIDMEINGGIYENAFEPIIFLTHAYFVDASTTVTAKKPRIENGHIIVWVGNEKASLTDVSQNTPIAIYENEISKKAYKVVTLAQTGHNSAIKAGDEVEIKIPIENDFGYYILRLGDDSFNQTSPYNFKKWSWGTNDLNIQDNTNYIGTAARAYRDCNWSDQLLKISKFAVNDDAYTLQEFSKINAPILNNDILPDDFVGGFDGANPKIAITKQPLSGNLTTTGEINKNLGTNTIQVEYQHTGTVDLPNGIDLFEYQITYFDRASNKDIVVKAKAYFYVLESTDKQYSACIGDNMTIRLKAKPLQTTFKWYETNGTTEIVGNPQNEITISNIQSTLKYKVLPQIPTSNTSYGSINFPQGELTIHVIPNTLKSLKWNGSINSIWHNPFNWTDMDGNNVPYIPAQCVDVVIPKVNTNYPALQLAAKCGTLTLADRAMIANTHYLEYAGVSYEFTLKQSEQNRWLMLSAPIRKVYTGDYMLRGTSNQILEEATYMSLFQTSNPDGTGTAPKSTFTRTFANVEQELALGLGFMMYADANIAGSVQNLKFPSTANKYTYNMSNLLGMTKRTKDSGTLSRQDGITDINFGAFITESAYASGTKPADGTFNVNYTGGDYILVVNPFPSFLNVSKFLDANTATLERGYKIWQGTVTDDFISLVKEQNGMVWKIKEGATLDTVGTDVYVAPFQAFFVKVKGGGNNVSITYQPETMTDVSATRNFSY